MKLMYFLVRKSWGSFVFSTATGALSGAVGAALIGVINEVLKAKDDAAREEFLIPFVVLTIAFPTTWLLSNYLLVRFGEGAFLKLRMELSRRLLATPLKRLEELGSPLLLASLSRDIMTITLTLGQLPNICANFAMLAGCLGYLAWLSPNLFGPLLGFIVVGSIVHQFAMRAGRRRVDLAREKFDVIFKYFQGLTEGTKELKQHQKRRQAFLEELENVGDELRRLNVSATAVFGLANGWGRVLFFIVTALLLFLLPRLAQVSSGELVSYTLVLLFLRTPLQSIMGSLPQIVRANVVLAKIQRLGLSLDGLERDGKALQRVAAEPDWNSLELRGVCFTYQGEQADESFTLGPLDFALKPGELLFLLGGNGSGKTTLAKLLLGLYVPEEGEILVDGQPVTDANRESYRSLFAAVHSEFYLFRNLLGLAHPELDDKAREYIRLLHLERKVSVEQGRLSTLDLSRGQRKRLALLTAYLEDRPIYLFDEWAADQDPVFKAFFYDRLLPDLKARGKTVIAITHDERYFGVADRVVKLEQGRFVDGVFFHEPVTALVPESSVSPPA